MRKCFHTELARAHNFHRAALHTTANDKLAANVVAGNVIALHSIPSPSLTNSLQLYLIFFRM